MGPTSSSGVNRVGDLWFFGTKVGCGPVMNYSIVGMESGGLRLIREPAAFEEIKDVGEEQQAEGGQHLK